MMDINPASITEANVPSILGSLVTEMQNMNSKIEQGIGVANKALEDKVDGLGNRLTTIEETLKEHERLFWGPFKFSRCDVIPFLWKNKWILMLIWLGLSVWISAIDWGVRALQWGNSLPPLKIP